MTIGVNNLNWYQCRSCQHVFSNKGKAKKCSKCKQETIVSIHWTEGVLHTTKLWHEAAFDSQKYPEPIAAEYANIHEFLQKREVYGAFLQLKDVYEIMIKLPVLIVASDWFQQPEAINNRKRAILWDLLKQMLSLGHWFSIANRMKDELPVGDFIVPLLEKAVELENHHQITSWRNNRIGHGALQSANDPEFQRDFIEKLEILSLHFQKNQASYEKLKIKHKQTKGWILELEEKVQDLYPYINDFTDEQDMYFFDSYRLDKKKVALLSYKSGRKHYEFLKEITGFFHYIETDISREYLAESQESSTFMEEAPLTDMLIRGLERSYLRDVRGDYFRKPKHLLSWVQEFLHKEKGLFLLQMKEGMGKSTFVSWLDEDIRKTRELEHTVTKAVYIHQHYMQKAEDFRQILNKTLSKVLRKTEFTEFKTKYGEIPANSNQPKQDFIRLLETSRDLYRKELRQDDLKLLLIMDGLDEVDGEILESEDDSIFKYIPDAEELPEGVFILLTARTDEELADVPKLREMISSLRATYSLKLEANNPDNVQFLKEYLKKAKITSWQDEILQKAQYKMLYLRSFVDLIQQEIVTAEQMACNQDFIGIYFAKLKQLYGEKYFSKVEETLLTLAAAPVPLSINELSYLMGEAVPTFQLMANLIDFRGWLRVTRGGQGNLYEIADEAFRAFIVKEKQERIQEMMAVWLDHHLDLDLAVNLQQLKSPVTYEGQSYFLSQLEYYLNQYHNGLENFILQLTKRAGLNLKNQLLNTEQFLLDRFQSQTELKRADSMMKLWSMLDVSHKEGPLPTAEALVVKGDLAVRLGDYESGEEALKAAEEILTGMNGHEDLFARCYGLLLKIYHRLGKVELFEAYKEKRTACRGVLQEKRSLAEAVVETRQTSMLIDLVQDEMTDEINALLEKEDFAGAIRKCEEYLKLGQPGKTANEKLFLARGYFFKGYIFAEKDDFDEAIAHYSSAIAYFEELYQNGLLENEIFMYLQSLQYRGHAYVKNEEFNAAKRDHIQTVKLAKRYSEQDVCKHIMAASLSHLADLHAAFGYIELAKGYTVKAIRLIEELLQTEYRPRVIAPYLDDLYYAAELYQALKDEKHRINAYIIMQKFASGFTEVEWREHFPRVIESYMQLGEIYSDTNAKKAQNQYVSIIQQIENYIEPGDFLEYPMEANFLFTARFQLAMLENDDEKKKEQIEGVLQLGSKLREKGLLEDLFKPVLVLALQTNLILENPGALKMVGIKDGILVEDVEEFKRNFEQSFSTMVGMMDFTRELDDIAYFTHEHTHRYFDIKMFTDMMGISTIIYSDTITVKEGFFKSIDHLIDMAEALLQAYPVSYMGLAKLYMFRGLAYEQMEDANKAVANWDSAEEYFNEALMQEPTEQEKRENQDELYLSLLMTSVSVKYYRDELDDAFFNMLDRAIELAEKLYEEDEHRSYAWIIFRLYRFGGMAAYELGKHASAVKYYSYYFWEHDYNTDIECAMEYYESLVADIQQHGLEDPEQVDNAMFIAGKMAKLEVLPWEDILLLIQAVEEEVREERLPLPENLLGLYGFRGQKLLETKQYDEAIQTFQTLFAYGEFEQHREFAHSYLRALIEKAMQLYAADEEECIKCIDTIIMMKEQLEKHNALTDDEAFLKKLNRTTGLKALLI